MRKKCRRQHWPLVNPLLCVKENNSSPDVTKLVLTMRESLEAFRRGEASRDDWHRMAEAVNHGWVLASEKGIGPEHSALFERAFPAMLEIAQRWRERGSMVLRAEELALLRDLVEVHDLQLQCVTTKELYDANARVEQLKKTDRARDPSKEPRHGAPA